MFKKVLMGLTGVSLAMSLTACSDNAAKDELDANDDEKAKAKVEKATSDDKKSEKKEQKDIWTYYNNAKATDVFEGLKFDIQKVTVSDKAPGLDEDGKEIVTSAVGMKIKIENTTQDKMYSTYPDQATLITSTGEQVEADMVVSDNIGGDIYEGVIKEGNVIWYLERGHAEDIQWVKFSWRSSYSDPNGNYENDTSKEHAIKIDLKKE